MNQNPLIGEEKMLQEQMDYYGLETLLTEEEVAFRDELRRFVVKDAMPMVVRHFENGTFPMELITPMAEMGLFGIHVEGYGCRRRNPMSYGLACQELGRCDSGLRAMFSVQNSLVMYPIFTFGSEDQRRRWLPGMASGEVIGCFGLSEPGHGSDPAGMETVAEKKGNDYVLNGAKMWITNGTIAHVALIWAKLEEEVCGFLVETGLSGFKASSVKGKFSYRTSPTALLTLKNCLVPGECRLPGTSGLKSVFECLNHARFGVACGALGSAIACYQEAKAFALKRETFGRRIASYQLVQERLVRMLVEITKSQLVTFRLGRLLDEGTATNGQISLAKLNNVREAVRIARISRDILGARGILADHHVIRHLCDLEAVSTLEGTEGIHILSLGRDLTGLSAFT